ncbi:PA14 domain-containing protein [Dyadobacter chenhuakuii]|uniref:PA14 domain-containing protein n=1 Tax=Dyadobacter chenhuakuii TaxID=2909339 RepID=A0ABY4XRD6_9BACT|nr:PA14 domain-containing protein [Dyadobacter chenhuakuii]MCF2493033.1 PA14 domain-containing protein [Dyadobacter chenhuakuii]USJ32679.1 PA14 domain-containing protein [Dyadobacter chenhuakuii]
MKFQKPSVGPRLAGLSAAILLAVLGSAYRGPATTFTPKPATIAGFSDVKRPREAWVLRSVLDARPRILSIALHDNLWLAYNTKTASLYKAWAGKINLGGPVYTSSHGPQPVSQGTTYMEEPDENPWRLTIDGKEVTPEISYKGHAILNNQVTLKYDLDYQGKKISVEEKPEFFEAGNGKAGFERVFTVANVPAGSELFLNVHLNSLSSDTDYKADGKFLGVIGQETVAGKSFFYINGKLILNNNGKTTLSVSLTKKPAQPQTAQQESKAEMVAGLFAKSDCNTCHNQEVKTVGPAYKAIAERYENNDNNKNALVTKVIKGGAGNWGQIAMSPHPDLKKEDAETMVSYILELDSDKERAQAASKLMPRPAYPIVLKSIVPAKVATATEKPGIAVNVYRFSSGIGAVPEINDEMLPVKSGSINALHLDEQDFGGLKDNFAIFASGYINIKKTTNIVFRLVCDDGGKLFIDDKMVIDNGVNHPLQPTDGEIILKPGKHPFKVEYYQGAFGKGLSLQWRPYGTKEFVVVPPSVFTYKGADIKRTGQTPVDVKKEDIPGDRSPLVDVHPSFTLAQARPDNFQPRVGGMDFLADGRMVVSTWDSLGSVYIVDGRKATAPNDIKVKRIAYGLAEPLGLKVVDDEIYIMQKQELTKLVDLNNDELIDEYQTICNGWKVSANFHEFAFGLVYKDGYFYGTLATAINPGGASTKPQIPDRGKVVKISKKDGSFTFAASGLRTPNGIGLGVDNEIFIADNQGDWLPANKIIHLQEGAWYGSRSVDFEGTANKTETPPVVWLTQDEIGNSPSQPARLNVGPYQNQMIHGDVTHGGIKRVFAEKVNGAYQGAVFRFTQGLEAGVNRLVWSPDGSLYIGGVGSTGNWGHAGKLGYGLQKLTFNNKVAFEMLAVRAKSDGVEIEFTEPLKEGVGETAADYQIRQWWFKPTGDYGGPKLDEEDLAVKSVKVSPDRKKATLQLTGMKSKHMVYIHLNRKTIISQSGNNLWSTEAWYNMNEIPKNLN